jgi:CubicO group peptidase (beta-lactamase class C family)
MYRKLVLIITLVTLTSNSSLAQGGGNVEQMAKRILDLSRRILDLMKAAEAPGLSIAIIEGGKIGWIGSFGVKNTKTGERVDAQTVFPAASLSKVVFAYAVLKLVDEGKLDLDVPLSKYVPLTSTTMTASIS